MSKKSKKNLVLLIMFMILSLLIACDQEDRIEETNADIEGHRATQVMDMGGRIVDLPNEVEKVFSTGPVGTILLYSLNPDKMVGWNYDLRPGEKEFILEKYHHLPNLGGASKEAINLEEVLKVNPDILIVMDKINDTTISQAEEIEDKTGKSIVLVDEDINKIDEVYEILGKVMGEEEKAEILSEYCRSTLDDVEEKSAEITDDMKVNVYYAEGPLGLETEPSGSWHMEILDMIGGKNVAKITTGGDKGKSEVSIEQLLSWNPDLILSWDDERGGYYSEIFKDPAWKDIRAVKREEVYEIPNKPFNWLDRPPSVNRILGLKWAGNLIYPEIYDYNMRDEVEEFYEKFYHYQLTEEEIDELLENSTRH